MVGAGGNGSDIATFGSPRLDRLIDTGFLQIFLAGHIPISNSTNQWNRIQNLSYEASKLYR